MKILKAISSKAGLYILAGFFITFVTILHLSSNTKLTASSEDARIVFETEVYDFGKAEQGPMLEYSYKFINEGDKPLVIEKVQPSCGCTGAATDGKSEYTEGESGEIKITFNTQGREGHQEKHIKVMTNDTENPVKDLKFSCDIESAGK